MKKTYDNECIVTTNNLCEKILADIDRESKRKGGDS